MGCALNMHSLRMTKCELILFVLVSIVSNANGASFCELNRDVGNCSCTENQNNGTLVCPNSFMGRVYHFVIEIIDIPNGKVTITGDPNMKDQTIDFGDYVPYTKTINREKINEFNFIFTGSTSYINVMKKLGIFTPENIHVVSSFEDRLNKQVFKKQTFLKNLYLTDESFSEIKSDLFELNPALRSLTLNCKNLVLRGDELNALNRLQELSLSSEAIVELPDGLFSNLRNLKKLELRMPKLMNISNHQFKYNTLLTHVALYDTKLLSIPELTNKTSIYLSGNSIVKLPEVLSSSNTLRSFIIEDNQFSISTPQQRAFAGLKVQVDVVVRNCGVEILYEDIFEDTKNISKLDFSRNRIARFHKGLLQQIQYLKHVDLSYNLLTDLQDHPFHLVHTIETMNFSHNLLESIPRSLTLNQHELTSVDLSNNKLKSLPSDFFNNINKLRTVDLSNNNIFFSKEEPTLFPTQVFLPYVNLSHNNITDMNFKGPVDIGKLDLSYNHIEVIELLDLVAEVKDQWIDLQYNKLKYVSFEGQESQNYKFFQPFKSNAYSNVYIDNNPFICDCHIYDLSLYMTGKMPPFAEALVRFVTNEATCAREGPYPSVQLADLNELQMFICEEKKCPEGCFCLYVANTNSLDIDCSHMNLTGMPVIEDVYPKISYLSLNLEQNNLTEVDLEQLPPKVEMVYLKNNRIKRLGPIPRNILVLDVSDNLISQFGDQLLFRHRLKDIRLSKNRIQCSLDCPHQKFIAYLQQNQKQIGDFLQVKCADGKPIASIKPRGRCDHNNREEILVEVVLSLVVFIGFCQVVIACIIFFNAHNDIQNARERLRSLQKTMVSPKQ